MEQEDVHHQRFRRRSAFSRLRAHGIQRNVIQNSKSEESSVWNEDTSKKVPENNLENIILKENGSSFTRPHRIQGRAPLIAIKPENNSMDSTEGGGHLGTQSALKQHPTKLNTNIKRSHHRRSCAPRFMNTESSSPWGVSASASEGYRSENTGNLYSSATKLSRRGDGENVPEEILLPDFKPRFVSLLKRRSRLVRQEESLENCSESGDKNENDHGRIPAGEEKDSDILSHNTSSRLEMNNQESASENRSEKKSCLGRGGKRRLSGARRRSVADLVRQRAQTLASLSSTEKTTASGDSHVAPMGHRPGNSVRRSRLSHRTPNSSLRRHRLQKDLPVTGITVGDKFQECRRILEFESGDEGENNEDQTAPLSMMIQTPIMRRASVLQNPVQQKQQKEVCEPVIKKGLLNDCVKTSKFRRRWSTHINQQPENNASLPPHNMELKVSRFGPFISKESDNSSNEGTEPKNIHLPGLALQEVSTSNCTSLSAKKRSNFPAPPASTKRIQRRRSAAVLCVRTPRKHTSLEAKSTSKFIGSSVSAKTPKGSQKTNKLRRSLVVTRRLSSQSQTIKEVATSSTEETLEYTENTLQDNVTNSKPCKVDASTNTTINFAKIKHVDLKILEDIENLLKEQAQLNDEAVLMQKTTTARRVEMKEKGLMESFMSSLSPLRRLKAIFSQNHEDETEVQLGTMIRRCGHSTPQLSQLPGDQWLPSDDHTVAKLSSVDRYEESFEHSKIEGQDDGAAATQEAHGSQDQSEMEWKSPKLPLDIRDHHVQWRRRQHDKRLTRTFQEPTIEEEFSESYQGNTSPFTSLVGDCERPSLAPMTPHSRRNVALLKLSLKEQLEQLYDN